ncbi:Aspartate aminotransferase, partial [Globisporangium splendens]
MKSETFSTSIISRSTTATSARTTTDHTTIPPTMTNTDAKMQLAIAAVATGGMSVREAARRHGVPRTTLQRKLSKDPQHATARSNSVTSPEAGGGTGSDTNSMSPSYSSNNYAATNGATRVSASNATPTSAMNASTMNNSVASFGSLLDGTQNTIGSFLSLSSVNGTTTTPSRKRSADAMNSPEKQPPPQPLGKGPHKAINCKVRMLCTSAGSALDELSNEMIQEGKCIYKLGLGQSPFPIPQCVVDELRANSHQREYLPAAGLPGLCEDIAAWGTKTLGMNYSRDDILVGPGTKELLFVLQTVYYGDLLLPNPSCTSYAPQASIAGSGVIDIGNYRNMIWLPTNAEDRWVLRPEVLEDHCAKDTGTCLNRHGGYEAVILTYYACEIQTRCTEDNDFEQPVKSNGLMAVARVARKYRVLVISDEIYSELHHSGEHLSISKYYPEGTIVSGGLSKWCGAGGWRMGFWMFPSCLSWLRKSMLVMASETYTSVASPIQHAARRAFVPDCIELAAYKEKCRKTLQIIGQWCAYQLQKMNLDVQIPQGGFTIFPSFARHRRALALRGITTDVQLCAQLLHDTGVAILPGSCFGRSPDELYVRIAFVDFKGEIALYLIESMDDLALEAINGFIQSVCPNLDTAMRKLSNWINASDTLLAPSSLLVSQLEDAAIHPLLT